MSSIKRAYSEIEELVDAGVSSGKIAEYLDLDVEFVEEVIDSILFDEVEYA